MRVITWNCRRASSGHALWAYFRELAPDLALLQEVGGLPADIVAAYTVRTATPPTRAGRSQRLVSAVLVRGQIDVEIVLRSSTPWVDAQLERFRANLLAQQATLATGLSLKTVCVYAPACPLSRKAYAGQDVRDVKLPENPEIWVSDLVVAALRGEADLANSRWLVAGDFNACETFDAWKSGPRGNRRWLDRMADLGLIECLRHHRGELTPTFRRPGADLPHCQIDYVFASSVVAMDLTACFTGVEARVLGARLSDHLPVVADFRDWRAA